MGSLVGAGAGAAEGLQQYLLQMMKEEELKRQMEAQKESVRHNKATEDLGQLQTAASFQNAAATRAATAAEQQRQEQNRVRDDTRSNLDDLMPGAMITPETRNQSLKVGAAAPERFKPFDVPRLAPSDYVSPEAEKQDEQDPVAYFLQGQPKQAPTPASLSQDTMVVDGKPTDVLVDRTQGAKSRVFTMQGEDVTDRARHYEKPNAGPQGFQVVQSNEGYIRFNRAKGVFEQQNEQGVWEPVANPNLATSQSTRSMMEGAQMLMPHVPELQNLAVALDKKGQFGPIMGRIRDLATRFGTTGDPVEDAKQLQALGQAIQDDPALNGDRLAGQFAAALGLMTSGMGRVHGGSRGGGSIQMITYLKSLLSGTSSLPMFLGRMDSIQSYLDTYAKGPSGARGAGGTETPAMSETDKQILDGFKRLMAQPQP